MATQHIKIPSEVVKYKYLIYKEKVVFAILAMLIVRANKFNNMNIAILLISKYTKESPATIQKHLASLQKAGFLEIIQYQLGDGTTQSSYILHNTPQGSFTKKDYESEKRLTNHQLYKYNTPTKDFVYMDSSILECKYLTLLDKAVCMYFKDISCKEKGNNRAYATVPEILEAVGVTEKTWQKSINRLKALGFVSRSRDTKKSTSPVYYYSLFSVVNTERFEFNFNRNKSRVRKIVNDFIAVIRADKNAPSSKRRAYRNISKTLERVLHTDSKKLVRDTSVSSDEAMHRLSTMLTVSKLKQLAYILTLEKYKNTNIFKRLGLVF